MARFIFYGIAFSFLLSISCKDGKQTIKKPVIDKEKINALFHKDVSQLLFNHLYLVLDSISYDQLTKNPKWHNAYAQMDMGLPHFSPLDHAATTCYLRGHQHYIEILGPKNSYNEPVGKSGIGFSLQNRTEEHFHLGVAPKLKKDSTAFLSATETVRMPIEDQQETWFKAFYTPSAGTALHTWYAFYNPTFLDRLYGQKNKTYTREAFLQKTYARERLFKCITAISMVCTLKDYERIVQEMRHLGCRQLQRKVDVLTIDSGDITLRLKPSATIPFSRITRIDCQLNNPDHSMVRFGNLTITNTGFESIWRLHELYKDIY
ncbi:DUF5829 family protein [Spongiimicrobium salis]|uniref:DUF5829 family protein n=1 Tax=Spongiimicrobium salis TaxID=1667022 RepID=UPI00374D3F41